MKLRLFGALVAIVVVLCIGGGAKGAIAGWPFSSTNATGMCTKWTSEYYSTGSTYFSGVDTAACLAGVTVQSARTDVMRVVNLHRYLIGLDPVLNYDSSWDNRTQECSLMCFRKGGLQHTGWTTADACYTAAGSDGCGSSNLAYGYSQPHATIAQWINDAGVSSLGHRRWVLSPSLGNINYGIVNTFSSLYVFGTQTNTNTRGYWTWPSEGHFPLQALRAVGSTPWWNYATSSNLAAIVSCDITYSGVTILNGACFTDTVGYGPYKSIQMPVDATLSSRAGCYDVAISFQATTGGPVINVAYTVTLFDCTQGTYGGALNCPWVPPMEPPVQPPVAPPSFPNLNINGLNSGNPQLTWSQLGGTSTSGLGSKTFSTSSTYTGSNIAITCTATVNFYGTGCPTGSYSVGVASCSKANGNNAITGSFTASPLGTEPSVPGGATCGMYVRLTTAGSISSTHDDIDPFGYAGAVVFAAAPSSVATPKAAPVSVPVAAPTATPVAQPVATPKAAPIAAPVQAPIAVPVQPPVAAPVAAPIRPPVQQPVAAPVRPPIAAPIAQPLQAPVAAPIRPPVAAPVQPPVAQPVQQPVSAPRSAPVAQPAVVPVAAPRVSPVAPSPIAAAPKAAAPKAAAPISSVSGAPTSTPSLGPQPSPTNAPVDISQQPLADAPTSGSTGDAPSAASSPLISTPTTSSTSAPRNAAPGTDSTTSAGWTLGASAAVALAGVLVALL
jgi:hypothetical protein